MEVITWGKNRWYKQIRAGQGLLACQIPICTLGEEICICYCTPTPEPLLETAPRVSHSCSAKIFIKFLGRQRDRETYQKVPGGQGVLEDQGDQEDQVVP